MVANADGMSRRNLLAAGMGLVAAGCTSSAVTGAEASPADTAATSPRGRTTAPPEPSAAPTSAPVPSGPAREVAHGPRSRSEVALTFHGAGDPALAAEILDLSARARERDDAEEARIATA